MTTTKTRQVYVETWGCQMNVADSERMLGVMIPDGFTLTREAESADLILLNTCNIREKARHKFVSRLGILRRLKRDKPALRIVVAGCVAQAEGEALAREIPEIDIVMGPARLPELPELLRERERTGALVVARNPAREGGDHDHDHDHDHHDHDHEHKRKMSAPKTPSVAFDGVDFSTERPLPPDVQLPSISGQPEVSRFVTIMQGCDNHCTFCVVPHTRGAERSRPAAEVIREVESLVAQGAREITLLGQNVNSYGLDGAKPAGDPPFVDLVRRVANLPGVERLRFTTSNPHDFSPSIANLFREFPKMGRYMHLPLQSGSDRILETMKRKVTIAEYVEKVGWLRAIDPNFSLSSDIIVGFPGETEDDFRQTLEVIERVRFAFLFAFKYSPRPMTPAATFVDQVPEAVKDDRLARLNALQDRITIESQMSRVGSDVDVLFIYQSAKEPGSYFGKTDDFRLVRVRAGRDLIGQVHRVRVTGGNKTALQGELL